MSTHPFTNLNLGNARVPMRPIVARLGEEWNAIVRTAQRTARLFPGSLTLGIDVLVSPDFRKHSVLEVNAFGNLLPGLLDERGHDTYEAAVWAASGGGRP